jgi:hypothetical protein
MNKTVKEIAVEAIDEAKVLEFGCEEYNESHMLETAERLSGLPYFMVKEVYERINQ